MSPRTFLILVISMSTVWVAAAHTPAYASKLTAIELEQKAKEDPLAARDLGLRYLQGRGVVLDKKKGVMWLEVAAKQGDQISARMLYRSFSDPKSEFFNERKAKEIEPLTRGEPPNTRDYRGPSDRKPEAENRGPKERPAETQSRWPSENLPRADPKGLGSGFAINRNGIFATNFHVIEGCHVVVVEYQAMRARAKLTAVSEQDDLAILEVPGKTEAFLALRAGAGRLGESVRVAGYPEGVIKISQGIVASIVDESTLQISASISSGNSGGPVVDISGNVIGIAVGKIPAGVSKKGGSVRGDDYNFAITSNKLQMLLSKARIDFSSSQIVRPVGIEAAARLLQQASAMILCYR
jgi:S1-C subfamily serine protease